MDEIGTVYSTEKWECEWGCLTIHLHPDPAHESQEWVRQVMTYHDALHARQLAEHGGDREALRRRLTTPASHAAVQQLVAKPEGTAQTDIQDSVPVEDSIPDAEEVH